MNSGGVAELAGRVRWGARGFDPYVGLRFVHCSHPCWPTEKHGVINQVKTFVVLACILASSSSRLIVGVAHRRNPTAEGRKCANFFDRAAEGRVAPHAWAGFSRDWALPGPLSRLPVRELTSVHECRDIRQEPT